MVKPLLPQQRRLAMFGAVKMGNTFVNYDFALEQIRSRIGDTKYERVMELLHTNSRLRQPNKKALSIITLAQKRLGITA